MCCGGAGADRTTPRPAAPASTSRVAVGASWPACVEWRPHSVPEPRVALGRFCSARSRSSSFSGLQASDHRCGLARSPRVLRGASAPGAGAPTESASRRPLAPASRTGERRGPQWPWARARPERRAAPRARHDPQAQIGLDSGALHRRHCPPLRRGGSFKASWRQRCPAAPGCSVPARPCPPVAAAPGVECRSASRAGSAGVRR